MSAGADLHSVADLKIAEDRRREIDQHMVDSTMLPGDIAAPAGARTVQHHGEIADAGQSGQAGASIAAIAAALIVPDRRAGLEVIGG